MAELLSRLQGALSDRYRIEREIGAGGMATVYVAQDLRHDRKVALKLMRPELSAVIGAERFLAEIKLTANLQHPHILPLFDSGEADGCLFYVMPFVEGESLRERLTREKQLPVGDAVRIATEVASALDYAHRHGVVHRDIKPENILLHDGRALVADFGIALAASKASGSRMTETGMSLGTPHYMSPEQAMGEREITPRSDVYALGAMLYEMLTGDPPFTGSTAQAVVARVLTEAPRPILPQRHTIPPHVEVAVLTALEKLPADRFATAAALAEALAAAPASTAAATGASYARTQVRPAVWTGVARRWERVRGVVPWGIAALAVTGAAGVALAHRAPATESNRLVRFDIQLPRDAEPVGATGSTIAFSPDGAQVVYVGKAPSGQRLYARRMDRPDPYPIPGSEGASLPFFSPDGRWLGFVQGDKLVKVALEGGPITPISATPPNTYGATWTRGDTIIFAGDSGLMDVPAAGGTPRPIARPDSGEVFRFPDVLPGDRAIVFGVVTRSGSAPLIGALDRRTGEVKRLAEPGGYPRYVNAGYLVVSHPSGLLSAVPFDSDRLEVTGPARGMADKLFVGADGDVNAGVSRRGDFAYQASPSGGARLVLVDRTGAVRSSGADSGFYYAPRLSPDGRRVAVLRGTDINFTNRDVWILDLVQRTQTRLTFDTSAGWPLWSPDGRRIVFSRFLDGSAGFRGQLFHLPADGSGTPEPLTADSGQWKAGSFEPGGRAIVYSGQPVPGAKQEVRRVAVGAGAKSQPVLATPFDNSPVSLSPDGRYIAYESNESGRREIYVRPYPGPGGRWQVSLEGGTEPIWSGAGGEIFYRNGDDVMAARVRTQPSLEVLERTKLFSGAFVPAAFRDHNYSVAADGKLFLMVQPVVGAGQALVVTLGWFGK
jgi:serine/threonine-protein kinase